MTGGAVRLLVVDDEEQILELLDLTLAIHGYEVCTASSGPRALELLAHEAIDVIVMDVLMAPWDGFETVRRMAAQHGPALPPVVFLSGLARPAVMPELGPDVVQEYLVKPFRPSQLVERIEEARRRRPSS
ncbi:histidine kinase [Deinococcus actinosclerus]|uniref:Histidine kinase n=1 Tax=Deinococcus actinosclerus TaxID=1768108 RepID=A0ABM5X4Q6_9DEIO|nr:response regulator [Deinococcus actinosclerus]ALW88634.1 histidine kinase [Deinococcus actinosclerus]